MQHGPVRNRSWRVLGKPPPRRQDRPHLAPGTGERPGRSAGPPRASAGAAPAHHLDESLTLELTTHNAGATPFVLTQALHTYLAVGDVRRVSIAELAHLPFLDKLTERTHQTHAAPWRFGGPCDRIYQRTPDSAVAAHGDAAYTVQDPAGQRGVQLQTQGSGTVVLWNPGAEGAHAMADMPDTAWTRFLCLRPPTPSSDVVALAPGKPIRCASNSRSCPGGHTVTRVVLLRVAHAIVSIAVCLCFQGGYRPISIACPGAGCPGSRRRAATVFQRGRGFATGALARDWSARQQQAPDAV